MISTVNDEKNTFVCIYSYNDCNCYVNCYIKFRI